MNRIDIALRLARGELTPEEGDRLLKGRDAGPTPPSGYSPVPGGQHGGYRKRTAKGWTYWYPDTVSAEQAAQHHASEARKHGDAMRDADRRVTQHGGVMPELYHRAVAEREEARGKANEHTEHMRGAQAFVDKQTVTRRILDRDAADKKRKAETDARHPATGEWTKHPEGGRRQMFETDHGRYVMEGHPDNPERKRMTYTPRIHPAGTGDEPHGQLDHDNTMVFGAGARMTEAEAKQLAGQHHEQQTVAGGKHFISERGGVKREVDTVARHGNFAVHGSAVPSATRRGNADHSFTITHAPTGMAMGHARTKAEATAAARHFHENAGDAGHDATFGQQPSAEAMKRLGAAYQSWHAKKAKKAMDDWDPMTRPDDAEDIQKGLVFTSAPSALGVSQDAFFGMPSADARLRKGAGDAELRGVGAGFDPRWNGGEGFGQ
jgi:sarcosine oxidase delta subunit